MHVRAHVNAHMHVYKERGGAQGGRDLMTEGEPRSGLKETWRGARTQKKEIEADYARPSASASECMCISVHGRASVYA
jgi:hypothetical protein